MLESYRVVDLTDERGNLAAFVLAGLGADVVLVEPPGGSAGRRRGPFAGDVDDGEHSLTFWGWNRGKRSVVLDLDTADGQASLAALVRGGRRRSSSAARCPSTWRRCGPPTRRSSRRRSPPFGSTGPKADWPATDLTVNAAGCQLAVSGDDDRAPGAHGRPAGVPPRLGRRRRRRARRPHRAGGERTRPARRRLGAAIDDAGDAELRPRRPARRRRGPAHGRGREDRWARRQAAVAVQGRLRVGDVPVRRVDRPVHEASDAVDLRGGLLRRGHPGQGLARLRQPALQRRRADGGVRPTEAGRSPTSAP